MQRRDGASRKGSRSKQGGGGNPLIRSMLDAAYNFQKSGNLSQAEVFYQRTLQAEPGNPFALYGLGFVSITRQDFPAAVTYLKQSWSNGYRAETVLTHLGIALQASGKPEDALEVYRQGIQLDPKNPRYPSNSAVVLAQLGQHEAALISAEQALKLDPEFSPAYINAGGILQSLGRIAEARQMFERATFLDPTNQDAREALRRLLEQESTLSK